MSSQRSDTAKALVRRWNLPVKHALYRKTGDWYHQLKNFPGALIDEHGYVIFQTEEAYRTCPQLRIRQDVGVPEGIKRIAGYTLAPGRSSVEEPTTSQKLATFIEGHRTDVLQNHIERDPAARAACLKAHGFACVVCGISFAERYGEIGIGFIHVHHLRPLAEGAREVDPVTDLCPLCPNCHAMAHKRNPPFTVAELKSMFSGGI